VTGIHEPRYHEASQNRHRQASSRDVERNVNEPPLRADRTDTPSTPPNVIRADEPPRDFGGTP